MSESTDNALEMELEALASIYITELTYTRKSDGTVDKIELLLHPATGHDTTKQYVCMTLVFTPSPKYPDEPPGIEIRNPRGLGEEEVASLVDDMKLKAEESQGEVMLYTLIEMAKDSLTEGNVPHCPCVVCLEHFHDSDVFHRTACYHYFHNRCLFKYLQHSQAQLEEEERDVTETRHLDTGESQDKSIACPICRTPLDPESLAVICPVAELEKEEECEKFTLTEDMKEQQQKMAEIYQRQKEKGGIIDLEHEKNKFLVNPEDRLPLRSATPVLSVPEKDLNSKSPDRHDGNEKGMGRSHEGTSGRGKGHGRSGSGRDMYKGKVRGQGRGRYSDRWDRDRDGYQQYDGRPRQRDRKSRNREDETSNESYGEQTQDAVSDMKSAEELASQCKADLLETGSEASGTSGSRGAQGRRRGQGEERYTEGRGRNFGGDSRGQGKGRRGRVGRHYEGRWDRNMNREEARQDNKDDNVVDDNVGFDNRKTRWEHDTEKSKDKLTYEGEQDSAVPKNEKVGEESISPSSERTALVHSAGGRKGDGSTHGSVKKERGGRESYNKEKSGDRGQRNTDSRRGDGFGKGRRDRNRWMEDRCRSSEDSSEMSSKENKNVHSQDGARRESDKEVCESAGATAKDNPRTLQGNSTGVKEASSGSRDPQQVFVQCFPKTLGGKRIFVNTNTYSERENQVFHGGARRRDQEHRAGGYGESARQEPRGMRVGRGYRREQEEQHQHRGRGPGFNAEERSRGRHSGSSQDEERHSDKPHFKSERARQQQQQQQHQQYDAQQRQQSSRQRNRLGEGREWREHGNQRSDQRHGRGQDAGRAGRRTRGESPSQEADPQDDENLGDGVDPIMKYYIGYGEEEEKENWEEEVDPYAYEWSFIRRSQRQEYIQQKKPYYQKLVCKLESRVERQRMIAEEERRMRNERVEVPIMQREDIEQAAEPEPQKPKSILEIFLEKQAREKEKETSKDVGNQGLHESLPVSGQTEENKGISVDPDTGKAEGGVQDVSEITWVSDRDNKPETDEVSDDRRHDRAEVRSYDDDLDERWLDRRKDRRVKSDTERQKTSRPLYEENMATFHHGEEQMEGKCKETGMKGTLNKTRHSETEETFNKTQLPASLNCEMGAARDENMSVKLSEDEKNKGSKLSDVPQSFIKTFKKAPPLKFPKKKKPESAQTPNLPGEYSAVSTSTDFQENVWASSSGNMLHLHNNKQLVAEEEDEMTQNNTIDVDVDAIQKPLLYQPQLQIDACDPSTSMINSFLTNCMLNSNALAHIAAPGLIDCNSLYTMGLLGHQSGNEILSNCSTGQNCLNPVNISNGVKVANLNLQVEDVPSANTYNQVNIQDRDIHSRSQYDNSN